MIKDQDTSALLNEAPQYSAQASQMNDAANRLELFNRIALGIPLLVLLSRVSNTLDNSITLAIALGAGTLSAVAVQTSRHVKGKIRDNFNEAWESSNPKTRKLGLGLIKERLDENIGHSRNIVDLEDFRRLDRRMYMPLSITIAAAAIAPQIMPLAYFGTMQILEWGDSQRMESGSRIQNNCLHKITKFDVNNP